jgi:lysophospholipase L1-like esterase
VGGLTDAQLADVNGYLGKVLDKAREKNARVRLVTGLPCNPAFKDTGPGDARRRALNTELLARTSPYLLPTFNASVVVSSVPDVDGQTLIISGYTSDGVHFLSDAQDAMASVLDL